MASTLVTYTGDNLTTDWTFAFEYLADSYVAFTVLDTGNNDVSINYTGELVTASDLRITPAVPLGYTIKVSRSTDVSDDLFGFGAGGVMRPSDIAFAMKSVRDFSEEARYDNTSSDSAIAAAVSEAQAIASAAAAATSETNAGTSETNAAASAAAAATSETNAGTSETNAAASAAAASTSETNAGTSETNAAASAAAASTSETNAATSETNAGTSETNAAASAAAASTSETNASNSASAASSAATNAQNALDSLNNKYIGTFTNAASDHAEVAAFIAGDAGVTLDEGDIYFDSTNNVLLYYTTASGWLPAAATTVIDTTTLNDVGNVTITSVATDDLIRWNGTQWVNVPDTTYVTTAADVRVMVEAATDSNVFTDADHSKLDGIEASATADQTGAEIKTALFAESDTNNLTDARLATLNGAATTGKAIAMAIVFG